MSASNQPVLVESTLILPGHTDICNVLASGDPSPTIQLIDTSCHRVDSGATSLDMDRLAATHWGLCVKETPEERLETLCLAMKKRYLECPSRDIPAVCCQ